MKDRRSQGLWVTGALLLMAGVAAAVLAGEARNSAADETLDEVTVRGEKEREKQRSPVRRRGEQWYYSFGVKRGGGSNEVLLFVVEPTPEVRFRQSSQARRLDREKGQLLGYRMVGDRLIGFSNSQGKVVFFLDDDVDETQGVPASIRFGLHAALIDLEYLRLRDTKAETRISVYNGLEPVSRNCQPLLRFIDDDEEAVNRFVLATDSMGDCLRIARGRDGDLLFADGLPEGLRQAVTGIYEPVASRIANKLGSEPGLVYVAWRPDVARVRVRYERSWDRSSLLLVEGLTWQEELLLRREELTAAFTADQIQRRFRQVDNPGPMTTSTERYLRALATAEQQQNVNGWLAESLPGWITDCAHDVGGRAMPVGRREVPSVRCGLLIQFVYDAVARAKSPGRERLWDVWRRLLRASYRNGRSGATSAEFLASSREANGIVRGLLDGSVDWNQFATDLERIGVRLRVNMDAQPMQVAVVSLANFKE
jgi:hypothetical protein